MEVSPKYERRRDHMVNVHGYDPADFTPDPTDPRKLLYADA